MIKKYDIVRIKPEFQDPGDSDYIWVAVNDEEKGRVDLMTVIPGFLINPISTVPTSCIEPTGEHHEFQL